MLQDEICIGGGGEEQEYFWSLFLDRNIISDVSPLVGQ